MRVPYNDKRSALQKEKQKPYKNLKKIQEEKLKSYIFYERERFSFDNWYANELLRHF